MKKTTKKLAVGTLLAAAGGYLAGILTAPKSGKETREDIKEATTKAVTEAEKRLKVLHSELNDLIAKGKTKAATASGEVRTQIDKAVTSAQIAKEKAREILSAVHEGGADDKDLKKALDEASKAVDHLKKFLTKG